MIEFGQAHVEPIIIAGCYNVETIHTFSVVLNCKLNVSFVMNVTEIQNNLLYSDVEQTKTKKLQQVLRFITN